MTDTPIRSIDRRGFLKATGAVGGAAALANLTSAAGPDDRRAREEVIVGVSASHDLDAVAADTPEDVEVLGGDADLGYLRVRVPANRGVYGRLQAQSSIATHEGVKFTEPNRRVRVYGARVEDTVDPAALGGASGDVEAADAAGSTGASDDPGGEADDTLFGRQYAPQTVRAPEAWEVVDGVDDVTVGVVDTGVEYDHPDLQSQFGEDVGYDTVDWLGFGEEDQDPSPEKPASEFHGTHVSGIVAATRDNGEGVAGVSDASLVSIRVIHEKGWAFINDIAQGIKKAADLGADVINMSLGSPVHVFLMKAAVSHAVEQGALPVAAAGNDGQRDVGYPAGFEEVMCVSATDRNDRLASFSNYGEDIDVAAPGVNVLSTMPAAASDGSGYGWLSGTSMATPVVAGIVAMVRAAYPDLSVTELRQRIKDTAVDVGLPEGKQGAGRVDALRAVTAGTGDGSDTGSDICGDSVETTQEGRLKSWSDGDVYTYSARTDDPCRLEVSLSGPPDADFDLYLTTDGRKPTFIDYDRRSWSDDSGEEIALSRDKVDAGQTFGVLVTSYSGTGDYTLTVREYGAGDSKSAAVTGPAAGGQPAVSGDGGRFYSGAGPELSLDDAIEPGRELAFHAGDVSGADYRWEFGDGTTAEGRAVTHTFDRQGEFEVRLVATDPDGNPVASLSGTVRVDDAARAGYLRATETESDRLGADRNRVAFAYEPRTADPDQVTVALSGPHDADFDLYLTRDGRTPTVENHDLRGFVPDSAERVVVEGLDADAELGVLVHRAGGGGRFSVRTEELGTLQG